MGTLQAADEVGSEAGSLARKALLNAAALPHDIIDAFCAIFAVKPDMIEVSGKNNTFFTYCYYFFKPVFNRYFCNPFVKRRKNSNCPVCKEN